MNKKVVVAGHICIDITPAIPKGKTMADILPGKLVQTEGVSVSTGGAVANAGLAMKFFGADVKLMGKVGCDAFGDMICNLLAKHNVEDGIIRAAGEDSSYSVVLAPYGVDRIFLHCPGANNTFCADDVKEEDLAGVGLFHFGYPPIMEKMFEDDGRELIALMKKVKALGILTSLDMTAVDPDSKAGRADWEKIIAGVLPYVDFFLPSVEELCYMLDKERLSEWQRRANGDDITTVLNLENDIKPLADKVMAMGAKCLVIKCGGLGLYCRTADMPSLGNSFSNREIFVPTFKPDKILSATGAGDTSIAAFLTSMMNGEKLDTCLDLAAGAGAMCVSSYDALSGLESLDKIKERIEKGWERNKPCL